YQPIIDISKGCVAGYEALARKRDANGQYVSAGALFCNPTIDKEHILALDRQVRRKAMEKARDMPADCFLAVNISPEWMRLVSQHGALPTINMAEELGINPAQVLVEFTESKGDERVLEACAKRYRAAGMRIAIDDFGAGYSQLDRIIAMEPDLIKLDMRLFKKAMQGGVTNEVVQSVAYLAERTGSQVICEGVETEEEFFFAMECGARFIQGFLFHPALPEFLDPYEPQSKVGLLLDRFVNHKIHEEELHVNYLKGMESLASQLKQTVLKDERFFEHLPDAPDGFLRFYLCDYSGVQISPNYEWQGLSRRSGMWMANYESQGHNWAFRPYFYQMLATERLTHREMVYSRPYQDRATGAMCQTVGCHLDFERILFLDIRYPMPG
ncbi:MAG: EAL domain-containing protein, partial [Pseudomonadales bacterium]|nr:EAL domain-containing protein [Pseudomonadales bacterium]